MKAPRICGVILSAGASSRMGRDKALLPWPPVQPEQSLGSSTFLSNAIKLFQRCTELVVVVAGKNATAIASAIHDNGAITCVNETPELGQFSSMKLGLQEALERGCDAAFIALVDRPPVAEATLAQLHAAFLSALDAGYWATIPEFEGRHGHPLAVGREMIEELLSAPLTSTARDTIHSHANRVLYLPVDDPTVTMNVNTWEEYTRLAEARF